MHHFDGDDSSVDVEDDERRKRCKIHKQVWTFIYFSKYAVKRIFTLFYCIYNNNNHGKWRFVKFVLFDKHTVYKLFILEKRCRDEKLLINS